MTEDGLEFTATGAGEKEVKISYVGWHGLKVIIGRAHSKEFKKEFFEWRMWFDN